LYQFLFIIILDYVLRTSAEDAHTNYVFTLGKLVNKVTSKKTD